MQSFHLTPAIPSKLPEYTLCKGLCLIDVGGGLRGVYAAGVLDGLLDRGIMAELNIGVSAGAANLATYIAGQKTRTYTYYHAYSFRKEYASLQNFIFRKSFFDLDYIYSDLSNSDGEYPLDAPALLQNPAKLITVATNALSGRPAYFTKKHLTQDEYSIFKASCAVPLICHAYTAFGVPCCDGTVSDPIPVDKALEMGAEKIVILLPRKASNIEEDESESPMNRLLAYTRYGTHFPAVLDALKKRPHVNNASMRKARELEEQGKALILSPETLHHVESLMGTPEAIDALYKEGVADAAKIEAFLQEDPVK